MRYVLSTFIFDPIDWIERFGWRPLTEHERLAAFYYYGEVGRRMGIGDIFTDFDEFRAFKRDYEQRMFRFSDTNQRIGRYTLGLFCGWFPGPLRPAVRKAVLALLDPAMLEAFGFPPGPRWLTRLEHRGLRARAAVVRLLPPRRVSRLTSAKRNRTYRGYPDGYRPRDLGAEPQARPEPQHTPERQQRP
jgi:hypothetical protein